MMLRSLGPILVAIVLLAGGCSRTEQTAPGSAIPANEATVVRITDGDTLRVDLRGHDERVRLIGINAPEVQHEQQAAECYGTEATARLAALLPLQSKVRLVRDREARDHYGRLLAYVYRAADNLFVNVSQVRDGYAVPLPISPNTAHATEFATAQQRAAGQRLGLWSRCRSHQGASTARSSVPRPPATASIELMNEPP